MGSIYLDNNATTKVDDAVVEAMLPYFTEQFGNPSSLHQFGNRVARAVKTARQQVQALLGAAHESEIIFTSCGTEADNMAILSALKAQPSRREIITTCVEHPAILSLCQSLEQDGYVIHYLKVDKRGRIDLDAYQALLSDRIALVSVMWANNETGTLFPIAAMAALARDAGIMFHTDAVQAVGKVPMDLKALPIDMLSLSGHKLHGPKGIGVLYVKRGTHFTPLIVRRTTGTWTQGRHGKCPINHRAWQGLSFGACAHERRDDPRQGFEGPAGGRHPVRCAPLLRDR